jgi:hypothetical protein
LLNGVSAAFDSWTSIVDRINSISDYGQNGYGFNEGICNKTFGNIWCYANAVVFGELRHPAAAGWALLSALAPTLSFAPSRSGFTYNNMLVAILVEAIALMPEHRSDQLTSPRASNADPVSPRSVHVMQTPSDSLALTQASDLARDVANLSRLHEQQFATLSSQLCEVQATLKELCSRVPPPAGPSEKLPARHAGLVLSDSSVHTSPGGDE